MKIKEEIKLELLSQDSVSVIFIKYIEYEGQKLQVGEAIRTSYVNSIQGREELNEQVKEPYRAAILAVWGNKPTIVYTDAEDKSKTSLKT